MNQGLLGKALTVSNCKTLFYACHSNFNTWHSGRHRTTRSLERIGMTVSTSRGFSSYNQMSKLIDEFSELFQKGKYFSLVNRFEANYINKSNYDLPISCINMVTASLLLLVKLFVYFVFSFNLSSPEFLEY